MEASLIRAWDSGRELQKDQTISKKNKAIIYQDIGVLSLHSTTSNTAHENYSTENILYQERYTRFMNNLSLLSLAEQASPQIRNEAKQKKNFKTSQAADAPFKQTTQQGLNFQIWKVQVVWHSIYVEIRMARIHLWGVSGCMLSLLKAAMSLCILA